MSREKLDEAECMLTDANTTLWQDVDRIRRSVRIHNDILRDMLADKQPTATVEWTRLGGELTPAGRRIAELEAEVERLTAERDVVRREIEVIREACGWEQSDELTSILVQRLQTQLAAEQNRSGHLDADVRELRQDLEEVNEFARSLGHGQGAIDNGLVDCLRESFAKYEQLRRLVREFQNARSCRVKWGDVMPANISVYGQVFEHRDEYKRFSDSITQLSGFNL